VNRLRQWITPTSGGALILAASTGYAALWLLAEPAGQPRGRYLGEACGAEAVMLLSTALVLTTLLPAIEGSFGGLDRVAVWHRNIALVASPYVRRGALSTLHIDQASVLRTMELVLGMQPLSSYTQYAAVPYDMFTSKPDLTPYTALTPSYDLAATNPAAAAGTPASVPLNLTQIDLAGPVLEAQLWQATRPGEPMPSALLRELAGRGGINADALAAWARGAACVCDPRARGLD